MAAEIVTKKRGRPKKAVQASSEASASGDQLTTVTTTTQNAKSRSFSTTESVAKSATPKKTTRKTPAVAIKNEITTSAEALKAAVSSSPGKDGKVSKPSIFEEATAFAKLKTSDLVKTKWVKQAFDQEASEKSRLIDMSKLKPKTSDPVAAYIDRLDTNRPQPAVSDSAPETAATSSRSPFLDTFLDDKLQAQAPVVPEESRISDRTAFNSSNISIDEIVSGAGVSDLSAFPEPKSRPVVRASAIPITPPKTFKSHSLRAFPDTRQRVQQPPKKRQVEPTSYMTGSFSALKAVQVPPASSPQALPSIEKSPAVASPAVPSATNPPQIKPLPATQPTPLVSKAPPRAIPASNPASAPPSDSSSGFRPKRPTEMTPQELLKNAQFRSLRRKYTGLIVGIPVLVVTSYVLWNRLNMNDEIESRMGGAAGDGRQRGILPKRILDDGALDRPQS